MQRKIKAISIGNGGICLNENALWLGFLSIGEGNYFGTPINIKSIERLENGTFNVKGVIGYETSGPTNFDTDILNVVAIHY